jgi:glyoxylase-like metal-dependent hydrolase (beta-lactamase superfamily II)
MTVQLYAFTCGHLTLPRAFMLKGETGSMTVPVPSYLIVHRKGRALFDTGLHDNVLTDPVAHLGERVASAFRFHYHSNERIGTRLEAVDIAPERIDVVINSHLHYDHCGGNGQLANANVVVQRRELEHAREVKNDQGYLHADWDTGQRVHDVDGEHDVFGDGSVVCFPTYGHTPGHQSVRVHTERGGEFVLCGDACYLKESLDRMHTPGIVFDREAMLGVFRRFRDMRERGAAIMYGHDPEFWKTVPQAPVRLG